jgi:hypothetical protein
MQLVKNILSKIWEFMKKFPFTCYGVFSFISYLIFSYDFFIIALIPGAPFMFLVYNIESILFPEYSHLLSTTKVNASDRILELLIIIILTILLDIFLHKVLIPSIKRCFCTK